MKNLLKLSFVLLIILTSCQSGGKKKTNGLDADGRITRVKHFSDDPNAPIEWKVKYKITKEQEGGVRDGESIRYGKTGQVLERINYVNNKKEGKRIFYHSTGKIYKDNNYKDNKLDGVCKRYDRNGNLTAEFSYKMGFPSVGLKEYTNLGKERKEPTIKIAKENEGGGTYKLNLSLTGENVKRIRSVNFYMGNLIENKYFHKNLKQATPTSSKKGILSVSSKEVGVDRLVNVVANAVTQDGLQLILQKKIKL